MYEVKSPGLDQSPVQGTSVRPEPGLYLDGGLQTVLNDLSQGVNMARHQPYASYSFQTRHRIRLELAKCSGADQDPWIDTSALHMESLEARVVRLGFEQRALRFNRNSRAAPKLTELASELWALVTMGYNNQQIAEATGRSPGAVGVAKLGLFKKVGANTPAHAVRRAYELGALVLPDNLEAAG